MRFKHTTFIMLLTLCFVLGAVGCNSEAHKSNGPGKVIGAGRTKGIGNRRTRMMGVSSGQFTKGRKDGLRDAKNSLFDESGGWMWLWMADEEYRQGYDQGWNEGRAEMKLKASQKAQPKTMRTSN